MKKVAWLLVLLSVIVISGCASDQGGMGGHEKPAGHQGCH